MPKYFYLLNFDIKCQCHENKINKNENRAFRRFCNTKILVQTARDQVNFLCLLTWRPLKALQVLVTQYTYGNKKKSTRCFECWKMQLKQALWYVFYRWCTFLDNFYIEIQILQAQSNFWIKKYFPFFQHIFKIIWAHIKINII